MNLTPPISGLVFYDMQFLLFNHISESNHFCDIFIAPGLQTLDQLSQRRISGRKRGEEICGSDSELSADVKQLAQRRERPSAGDATDVRTAFIQVKTHPMLGYALCDPQLSDARTNKF